MDEFLCEGHYQTLHKGLPQEFLLIDGPIQLVITKSTPDTIRACLCRVNEMVLAYVATLDAGETAQTPVYYPNHLEMGSKEAKAWLGGKHD